MPNSSKRSISSCHSSILPHLTIFTSTNHDHSSLKFPSAEASSQKAPKAQPCQVFLNSGRSTGVSPPISPTIESPRRESICLFPKPFVNFLNQETTEPSYRFQITLAKQPHTACVHPPTRPFLLLSWRRSAALHRRQRPGPVLWCMPVCQRPTANGISLRTTIAPIINSPRGNAGSSEVPSGSWSHDLALLLRANCFSVVLCCQCYHGW